MHLAGCQSLLDRRLALLMFVALSRSFRVSGVHVDFSQQANEEVSSLTEWNASGFAVFIPSFFFQIQKNYLGLFFLCCLPGHMSSCVPSFYSCLFFVFFWGT